MVDLGCQDTDWVVGNVRGFRCDFTAGRPLWAWTKENVVILGAFLDGLGP